MDEYRNADKASGASASDMLDQDWLNDDPDEIYWGDNEAVGGDGWKRSRDVIDEIPSAADQWAGDPGFQDAASRQMNSYVGSVQGNQSYNRNSSSMMQSGYHPMSVNNRSQQMGQYRPQDDDDDDDGRTEVAQGFRPDDETRHLFSGGAQRPQYQDPSQGGLNRNPVQPPYPDHYGGGGNPTPPPRPPKKTHLVRNVIIALSVILVCFALAMVFYIYPTYIKEGDSSSAEKTETIVPEEKTDPQAEAEEALIVQESTQMPESAPESTPIPEATATPQPTPTPQPTSTPQPSAYESLVAQINGRVTSDQIVYFGSYGYDYAEPVGWKVLKEANPEEGDYKVMLISEKIVDILAYNDDAVDTAWSQSTIRSWMNDHLFHAMFTPEEQAAVLPVNNAVTSGYSFGEDQVEGADYLSLLGAYYAELYSDKLKDCVPNEYIRVMTENRVEELQPKYEDGTYSLEDDWGMLYMNDGHGYWWLRNPGQGEDGDKSAMFVSGDNTVVYEGMPVENVCLGVRPVMWINLESQPAE